jgi:hypothetical protein
MQPRDGGVDAAARLEGVVKCRAFTLRGARCRARAVTGDTRCVAHGGRRSRPVVEAELVATVLGAAESDWRAAGWVLERRFPQRWRRGGLVEEREPPAAPEADGLDELAGRREARRSSA